jgi:uncharacterized protein (DUF488 family)
MSSTLYTIGHSDHPLEAFLALLHTHAVNAIADVRSQPLSRRHPQFNRQPLQASLRKAGVQYVFLGQECGARTDDPACYEADKVQYERLAQTAQFRAGLERIRAGAQQFRLALMCAERDPLSCHRTILVSRALVDEGLDVAHILADGALETQAQALQRLREQLGLQQPDLFVDDAELEILAYRQQGERIAYSRAPKAPTTTPPSTSKP